MVAKPAKEAQQFAPAEGFIGRIPIKNLWLLMLYASELFRAFGTGNVAFEDDAEDLPDLVAKILAHAVETRQRRRLSSGYRSREASLNRLRGRIDALTTERHQLLDRGLVACRFDELTIDTPRNRYVRAALESVSTLVRSADVSHRCRSLAKGFQVMGVSGEAPTRSQMSVIRFGRNDAEDRFMVAAAKLALDLSLPTETSGSNVLSLPDREATWVRDLFEKAVGGFYSVVLKPQGWHVKCGGKQAWQVEHKTAGIKGILPVMETDVVLNHLSSGRRVVIDTKFTDIVTNSRFRKTVPSRHLYQIYAYLRSQVGSGDASADSASGLLLHPAINQDVDETAVIQGHPIRFATVDLTASHSDIRARLMKLTDPFHT
ncbi:5-methylcytosine-specific restriction endonuclease system specificity protein McrC [Alkalisalibacterium limincola]|uniref:5-methylcytosine-specific restriction endonuclease system specificity protein McrC n=1 Tax=Alkalisalibacterium limincola TaxID=2699169 RepID=A0A5C8KNJ0_9GAMM|nr:5-methylcytosine-specific restriction endonuclease system specificity protein McrC [Alkalisalibacterium limincola]TXK61090.1 5-methylcytosine-specific restriction endonuclease system specificity protein McrC [Alkalisalibacterium limincola]